MSEQNGGANWTEYARQTAGVPQSTMGYDKAVYEFRGGEGEEPKADEKLETQLFGAEHHLLSGLNFDKYDKIKVKVKAVGDIPKIPAACQQFDDMGLHPQVRANVVLARYLRPTPVQKHSVPAIIAGYDCMAHAQTGSGKTAAFLIPVLSKLFKREQTLARQQEFVRKAEPYALIVVPTRELANQIFDETRRFCYRSRFRPACIYGGAPSGEQKAIMQKGCDILIATPGRLKDFMERGCVSLKKVKTFILDEADRMLDMGFEPDIRTIAEKSDMPDIEERQTLLFSATLPKEVRILAQDFLKEDFLFISIGRVGAAEKNVTQKVEQVQDYEKRDRLFELLMTHEPKGRTLVFVDTKRMADTIDDFLFNKGFPCTSLHGDRSQREREDALEGFRKGTTPIMIATDVAARGLDIKDIVHVVNFDCPKDIDSYVHRIGRTARAGNVGFATTFYNDRNEAMGAEIAKILLEAEAEVPEFLQEYTNQQMDYDDVADEDFEQDENEQPASRPAPSSNGGGGGGGGSWDSGADAGGGGGGGGGSWDAAPASGGGGGGSWDAAPASGGGGGGSWDAAPAAASTGGSGW